MYFAVRIKNSIQEHQKQTVLSVLNQPWRYSAPRSLSLLALLVTLFMCPLLTEYGKAQATETEIILHAFGDGSVTNDGQVPSAPLIQGSDGNFYGVTTAGGYRSGPGSDFGNGTVFKMTPQGNITILHAFTNFNGFINNQEINDDGASPMAALVEGHDGNFYGTAYAGGTAGYGTILKLHPQASSL